MLLLDNCYEVKIKQEMYKQADCAVRISSAEGYQNAVNICIIYLIIIGCVSLLLVQTISVTCCL